LKLTNLFYYLFYDFFFFTRFKLYKTSESKSKKLKAGDKEGAFAGLTEEEKIYVMLFDQA
jgi:hypothetical protein